MSIQDELALNEGYPEAGYGENPMTSDDIREQNELELKRLIWNAKKLAEKLHAEPTPHMRRYQQGETNTLPYPPLNRSEDAYVIRELLGYISEHDVRDFREIELKVQKDD